MEACDTGPEVYEPVRQDKESVEAMNEQAAENGTCPTCGQDIPKTCGLCKRTLERRGSGWGVLMRRRNADQGIPEVLFGFSCGCYDRWYMQKEIAEFEATTYLDRLT